ncbi:MAG: site-specific DNA-methyltransferase [Xanthomonadales bacterium]|nr:site-specific DNA-methyltransferase [Xanthomonadales bacterium]|tara:strand:- start:6187 stop:7089 length:903 start_codon:yes stop_codon:yes gene_type:complete
MTTGPTAADPGKKYHVGDAFDLIQTLEDESLDLVITSPPYWGLRTYGQAHNWNILKEWEATDDRWTAPPFKWYRDHGGSLGLEPIPDWFIAHLCEFFDLVAPKLKQTGNVWVNLGDTYFARWSSIRDDGRQGLSGKRRVRRTTPMGGYLQEKQLLMIPARFAIAMQDRRWILRNDLIWHKPNVPPRPERDRLRASHEHFFHFVKRRTDGRPKYFYDLERAEPRALDVVKVNAQRGVNGHSATFSTDVVRARIESSAPLGGTVLDPFCGTGSAVELASELGRNAIGFEANREYLHGKIGEI